MRKNTLAIIALLLCLVCLALTALVWLDSSQALRTQESRLAQLENQVDTLEARLAKLETTGQLELRDFTLTAKAWADGSGADVTLTAWPEPGWEDMELTFVAETAEETGGVQTANVLCQWDGTAYTATASLRAANDYCYYLSAGEGNWISLAGPWGNTAMDCVYLADSLEGYAAFELRGWSSDVGAITLQQGFGVVQLPLFDSQGGAVAADRCEFRLLLGEEVVTRAAVSPTPGEAEGSLEILVQDMALEVPELEDGQQVELWLNLELSNGSTLETWICGWTMNGGQLGQVAG